MTLTNESVIFTPAGIWIQLVNGDRFRFYGDAYDLLAIMVYHQELDIVATTFRVRDCACVTSGHYCGKE